MIKKWFSNWNDFQLATENMQLRYGGHFIHFAMHVSHSNHLGTAFSAKRESEC